MRKWMDRSRWTPDDSSNARNFKKEDKRKPMAKTSTETSHERNKNIKIRPKHPRLYRWQFCRYSQPTAAKWNPHNPKVRTRQHSLFTTAPPAYTNPTNANKPLTRGHKVNQADQLTQHKTQTRPPPDPGRQSTNGTTPTKYRPH